MTIPRCSPQPSPSRRPASSTSYLADALLRFRRTAGGVRCARGARRSSMRNILFFAALLVGCGPGQGLVGNPNDLKGLISIDVMPPMATIAATGTTPGAADFTATGHFTDGHSADLTSKVAWSLADSSFGTVS